jgi:hypothetical protein
MFPAGCTVQDETDRDCTASMGLTIRTATITRPYCTASLLQSAAIVSLLTGLLLFPGTSPAVELRPLTVVRGTEGQVAAPVTIRNLTTDTIQCLAQLAHWYSMPLLVVAPGESASADLWFEPDSGTINLLNERQENMPVETLLCTLEQQGYPSRVALRLDRLAFALETRRLFHCRDQEQRLVCD